METVGCRIGNSGHRIGNSEVRNWKGHRIGNSGVQNWKQQARNWKQQGVELETAGTELETVGCGIGNSRLWECEFPTLSLKMQSSHELPTPSST